MARSDGTAGQAGLRLMWELIGVREAAGDLAGAIRLTEEYMAKRPVPLDGVDVWGLIARHRLVVSLWKAVRPTTHEPRPAA